MREARADLSGRGEFGFRNFFKRCKTLDLTSAGYAAVIRVPEGAAAKGH
jgi:hypothetical protein